jgi:hypothetical protein
MSSNHSPESDWSLQENGLCWMNERFCCCLCCCLVLLEFWPLRLAQMRWIWCRLRTKISLLGWRKSSNSHDTEEMLYVLFEVSCQLGFQYYDSIASSMIGSLIGSLMLRLGTYCSARTLLDLIKC